MPRTAAWFSALRGGVALAVGWLLWSVPRASVQAAPDVASEARQWPSFSDALSLPSPLPRQVQFAASSFSMGSDRKELELALADCTREIHGQLCEAGHFSNEGPVRQITLSAFRLDRYEVTVAQYERCVRAQRCPALPYFKGAQRFAKPDHPVSLVTWAEARDYCHFVGAELPTEAQWERAARGLSHRRYPWGDLYNPRRSNHGRLAWDETDDMDGFRELAPVGSFPSGATPERVFDLAGNVEEWVRDRYDSEYDRTDTIDPRGPSAAAADSARSVRGGSYTSPGVRLRSASRTTQVPTLRDPSRGFRCAESL